MSTSDRTTTSLISALSEAGIPAENHEFIRAMTDTVGIVSYRVVHHVGKSYVVAQRRDGQRDLHIEWGATNGFTSEDETIRVAPDAVGRGLNSRNGTWFVLHPLNKARVGTERSRSVRRSPTRCSCGMELSLTGVCSTCD